MIGIRVDVNRTVATGHIMRDISIALCLQNMGEDFIFLSADDNCVPYLEPYGFPYIILESDWEHLEHEIEGLRAIIMEYGIDSLLVDSYYVTPDYMQVLSDSTKVTYFDEMYLKGYGCQQLINGVLEPPDYGELSGRAFLGPDYVSLRKEFSQLPEKQIRDKLEKILITSGGTDNFHFSKFFLEHFLKEKEWNDTEIILVLGNLCVDKAELLSKYENEDRVEIHVNTKKMAELMQEADYCITAGGTTLYEICAVGLAGSSFVIGDNQIEITQSFHRMDLVSFAGDFRKDAQGTYENILTHLKRAVDRDWRQGQAKRLQKIVDGKGAERIAKLLR